MSAQTMERTTVWHGWPPLGTFAGGSVVTMGVVDGFHRGHEALVRRAVGHADRLGVPSVLVTFSPHPMQLLAPGAAPRQLMSLEERISHALSLGVTAVVVLPFTAGLAAQSAADFVTAGLAGRLGARLLVVGSDFRCGRGGEGDVVRLAEIGRPLGMAVEPYDEVHESGLRCSSTEVRRCLAHGDRDGARLLLGRDDDRVLGAP